MTSEIRNDAAVAASVPALEAAALELPDVLARLRSNASGLTSEEAAMRLRATGPNAVRSCRARALPVLMSQLRSPLLILLAATAIASAFLGQIDAAVIIGVILVASAGLGFVKSTARRKPRKLCIRVSGTVAWR